MGNEKIAWNVPEGTKGLVKLLTTVLPGDWTEGQIASWAVHALADSLILGKVPGVVLTTAERNLLQERADRLREALDAQVSGKLAWVDEDASVNTTVRS